MDVLVESNLTCTDFKKNKAFGAIQQAYKVALASWLDEVGGPLGVATPVSTSQKVQCHDPVDSGNNGGSSSIKKRIRVIAKTKPMSRADLHKILQAMDTELLAKRDAFPQRVSKAAPSGGEVQSSAWAGSELRYKSSAAQVIGKGGCAVWDSFLLLAPQVKVLGGRVWVRELTAVSRKLAWHASGCSHGSRLEWLQCAIKLNNALACSHPHTRPLPSGLQHHGQLLRAAGMHGVRQWLLLSPPCRVVPPT
jgi:hypothetical protein